MKLINFALSATIALTATLSFLPSGRKAPSGYWENSDTYVYYTLEDATFLSEENGVAYFETADGAVKRSKGIDISSLQEDSAVTLTFKNRETREEYLFSEEYGNESITRNNARIINVD